MRDFVLYMVFSVIESSAMFYLAFKIFKIDIFFKEIVFAGCIMGFISYALRHEYGIPDVDQAVQFLLFFLFIWMLFRIHVFYATILAGMTSQLYLAVQTVYYFLMAKIGVFESTIPYILSIGTFALQTLAATTVITIGWIVGKRRSGFDFVPDTPSGKLQLKPWEKVLFALTLPSIIFSVLMIQLTVIFEKLYLILPFVYTIVSFSYMYFSYRRDRVMDD